MWRRSAGGQVGVYCRGASILLVGTHKDRVPDPRDHERISYLLIDRFQAPPPPCPGRCGKPYARMPCQAPFN